MVIRLPPSIVVSALMVFVLVTVIVAAPPQLKVTVPLKLLPPGRQASNAASVQLALVPVPTTHASAGMADRDSASTRAVASAFIEESYVGERRQLPPKPPSVWPRRSTPPAARRHDECWARVPRRNSVLHRRSQSVIAPTLSNV